MHSPGRKDEEQCSDTNTRQRKPSWKDAQDGDENEHDNSPRIDDEARTSPEGRTPQPQTNITIKDAGSSSQENIYFTGRLPTIVSVAPTEPSDQGSINDLKPNDGHKEEVDTKQSAVEKLDIPEEEKGEHLSHKRKEISIDKTQRKSPQHDLSETNAEREQSQASTPEKEREETDLTAINSVAEENEANHITDSFPAEPNMTVGDIDSFTSKVVGTTYTRERHSQFDNLQHLKNIDSYIAENRLKRETTLGDVGDKQQKPEKTLTPDIQTDDIEKLNDKQEDRDDAFYDATHSEERKHKLKMGHETNVNEDKTTSEQKDQSNTVQKERGESDVLPTQEKHHADERDKMENKTFLTTIKEKTEVSDDLSRIEKKTPDVDHKQPSTQTEEETLREIIISAKRAIGDDTIETTTEGGTSDWTTIVATTTDNTSAVTRGTFMSVKGDSLRKNKRPTRTTPSVDLSSTEGEASLICSSCLRTDNNVHSSGFCAVCQKYLCSTCITTHTVNKQTAKHEILACYCKNELEINKYIKATAFCSNCNNFLCEKCTIDHAGKRMYRHHKIIQSSFVSKPHNLKTTVSQFLNSIQDQVEAERAHKKPTKKEVTEKLRKSKAKSQKYDPYKFGNRNVLPSLYPGPKKSLGSSYWTSPKWPKTSVPALPYLVQPVAVRQRMVNNPYIAQHQPMGFAGGQQIANVLHAAKITQMKTAYRAKDSADVFRLRSEAGSRLRLHDLDSSFANRSIASRGVSESATVGVITHPEPKLMKAELVKEHSLSIPFPSGEDPVEISSIIVLMNARLAILDKNNNNIKYYTKAYNCKAALQFHSKIVQICASNLCPSDMYAATAKHVYEISVIKGLELQKKYTVDIKRIEGIACWKYGWLVIQKKTGVTWELRLFDYRGNIKSKLEVLNPASAEIQTCQLYHVCPSRGSKYLSISDTKNACVVTVDLVTRKIVSEVNFAEEDVSDHDHEADIEANNAMRLCPTHLTSDHHDNLYAVCGRQVMQVSRRGELVGALLSVPPEAPPLGSLVYNRYRKHLYVQTGPDIIKVYKVSE